MGATRDSSDVLRRIDSVLARWSVDSADQESLTGRPNVVPAHLMTVWGLTAQVFNQGRFLRPHIGSVALEIAPIVRSQLETALTVQWIVLRGPKALPGFLNEGVRQRVNLGRSMRDAGWGNAGPDMVERLANERVPVDGLDDQARQFARMVKDFEGAESVYALYRFMSGLSHPSASVVDEYAVEVPGGEGIELLREPRGLERTPWSWSVLWSLVWAGRALDYVTDRSPNRHFYNAVARESGMPDAMLSADAQGAAFVDKYNHGRRRGSL